MRGGGRVQLPPPPVDWSSSRGGVGSIANHCRFRFSGRSIFSPSQHLIYVSRRVFHLASPKDETSSPRSAIVVTVVTVVAFCMCAFALARRILDICGPYVCVCELLAVARVRWRRVSLLILYVIIITTAMGAFQRI